MTNAEKELKAYKKEATQAAKDFGYPKVVFEDIQKAETISAISRVMHDARKYIQYRVKIKASNSLYFFYNYSNFKVKII